MEPNGIGSFFFPHHESKCWATYTPSLQDPQDPSQFLVWLLQAVNGVIARSSHELLSL